MKPKAYDLLQHTKDRAFQQIQYALKHERSEGYYGSPYRWQEDGQTKECYAYNASWYALRLMDWGGDSDQPCYFNTDLHEWDTVYNMPIDRLVDCADSLIRDRIYRRMNK